MLTDTVRHFIKMKNRTLPLLKEELSGVWGRLEQRLYIKYTKADLKIAVLKSTRS